MLWNTKWFPGTNLQDLNLDWILKKVSALRGGSTGQYLYKKSDKDFDFGWKTGGGGGGGTSDYLDLDNKPSINNVELDGNKTAADLGLAASSDIPEIPVQSVNGKTGAVVLDATDVGAGTYTKPSGGIPKTDLTSAVQTSLDKADTALQAVPPSYRTATAQDAIDAAQDAEIGSLAGSLAMIESSPATAAHAVGDYIVYNGQLYKVTASTITQGQTLTPGQGGNIEAVTVGSAIMDINNHYPNSIKVFSIATDANQSGFNITALFNSSLAMFYVDNGNRAALITKSSGNKGVATMLTGTFNSAQFNNDNMLLGTGSWTRAIIIATSNAIDKINVAPY